MGSITDAPGRILLVGADPAAAHELLSAIRQQPAPQEPPPSYPWRLDTRYYTADVHFDVRHLDQCGEVQLGDGAYEAVLLVFDAARRAGFDSLQAWWDAAGGGDADLGVRLAVATRLRPGARPAWLAAAEEWCTEQLVEYVETDQAHLLAAAVAEGQQQTAAGTVGAAMGAAAAAGLRGRAEETAGVHRICEALQAHMWPGMQLKPSPRHGAAAPAATAAAAQGTDYEHTNELEEPAGDAVLAATATPNGLPAAVGVSPAANGTTADTGSAAAAAAGAAGAASEEAAAPEFSFADYVQSSPGAAAVAAAGMQLGAGGTGGAAAGAAAAVGEEEGAEQMERLFAQVSSHREQLAQMSDAQRRDAAAAMVSQLMAAMGLDEEEEEEEGER